MLDRLLARLEPKGVRFETECIDGGGREQGEAIGSSFGGAGALEQTMGEDDVGSRQLVSTGDATPDEGPVVDKQLEVESRSQTTRVAVATRRLVDAPQAPPEGDVGRLDRVEQQRPVGASVFGEEECCVTLELDSRKGGSSRPTIVSSRSPAMAGACSISLPERYAV